MGCVSALLLLVSLEVSHVEVGMFHLLQCGCHQSQQTQELRIWDRLSMPGSGHPIGIVCRGPHEALPLYTLQCVGWFGLHQAHYESGVDEDLKSLLNGLVASTSESPTIMRSPGWHTIGLWGVSTML